MSKNIKKALYGNSKTYSGTDCDGIRERLSELHDIHGLSWRNISRLVEYRKIPPSTLRAIAKGERAVPDRYREQLGIPHTQPVPVCIEHGQPHVWDCRTQLVKPKSKSTRRERKWRDARTPQGMEFYDLPVGVLRAALENRSDV